MRPSPRGARRARAWRLVALAACAALLASVADAASAFERMGVPAPAAKHVVLRRNGEFFGLYVMVENVDGEFLERKGQSPAGPLFKAVHWRESNLRPRAPDWAPCRYDAKWESSWGACPEIYR